MAPFHFPMLRRVCGLVPRVARCQRFFSTAESTIVNVLLKEMKATEKYAIPPVIESTEGSTTMKISKSLNDLNVTVDWQCYPLDMAGVDPSITTEFQVTIERTGEGCESGVALQCRTYQPEEGSDDAYSRFSIESVRSWRSSAQRDQPEAYGGPMFYDVATAVQEGLDMLLESAGVDDELCDFIDASAIHKEQSEYKLWLGDMLGFFEKRK